MAPSKVIALVLLSFLKATYFNQFCVKEADFRQSYGQKLAFPPIEELLSVGAQKLGYETEGEAYKVIIDSKKAVIKVRNLRKPGVSFELIDNEIRIYQLLKDVPGIPALLGCFYAGHYVVLVLENGGVHLVNPLEPSRNMSVAYIAQALYELSNIVRSMHELNVRHGEISLDNFLVNSNQKRFYLTDFGLSCLEGEEIANVISRWYSPPEVQRSGINFCSAASDVWQFSLLGIELFLQKSGVSFKNLAPGSCFFQHFTRECHKALHTNIESWLEIANSDLYDLLLQGISYDPSKRPSSFAIVSEKLYGIIQDEEQKRDALRKEKSKQSSKKEAPIISAQGKQRLKSYQYDFAKKRGSLKRLPSHKPSSPMNKEFKDYLVRQWIKSSSISKGV